MESHFDIVDKFSPAEDPRARSVYTHKLDFELDTSLALFKWLPEGHWLRDVEVEGSLDYLATGLPKAGDEVPVGGERFIDAPSPWSFSVVFVIPIVRGRLIACNAAALDSQRPQRRICVDRGLALPCEAHIEGRGLAGSHVDLGRESAVAWLHDLDAVAAVLELDEEPLVARRDGPALPVHEHLGISGLHAERQRAHARVWGAAPGSSRREVDRPVPSGRRGRQPQAFGRPSGGSGGSIGSGGPGSASPGDRGSRTPEIFRA